MKSDYSGDIFKQLQETMKRLDKMESPLKRQKQSTGLKLVILTIK